MYLVRERKSSILDEMELVVSTYDTEIKNYKIIFDIPLKVSMDNSDY